jgi:hypothetical protein
MSTYDPISAFRTWKHSKYCERIANNIKEKNTPAVLHYAAWSWQHFRLEMNLRKVSQKTHQGTIILTVKTPKILKSSICQNKIPPNAQKHNFFRVKTMIISIWNLREKNASKNVKRSQFSSVLVANKKNGSWTQKIFRLHGNISLFLVVKML